MKHAHVKIDGKEIPLIGIDKSATEEECSICHKMFHLQEITLDIGGRFTCRGCRVKEIIQHWVTW